VVGSETLSGADAVRKPLGAEDHLPGAQVTSLGVEARQVMIRALMALRQVTQETLLRKGGHQVDVVATLVLAALNKAVQETSLAAGVDETLAIEEDGERTLLRAEAEKVVVFVLTLVLEALLHLCMRKRLLRLNIAVLVLNRIGSSIVPI
jgi:hypothetical protein